jgi:hypothetical protein
MESSKIVRKKKPIWIKTIRQLIHWQYAKLIAGGRCGKRDEFPLVMSEFKKLEQGKKKLSGILRDNKKLLFASRACAYCGSEEQIQLDHIIPISKGGADSFDNLVYACKKCNLSKSNRDILEWYGEDYAEELPSLVFAKYLKLVYKEHEKQGTLDKTDINGDGDLDYKDLSAIFMMKKEDDE